MRVSKETSQFNLETPENQVRQLKTELRISKKAEERAKEQLQLNKKQLQQLKEEHANVAQDNIAIQTSLQSEIQVLKQQLESICNLEPSVFQARTSPSKEKQDGMNKIVEDYQQQLQSKTKQIQTLSQKLEVKKSKEEILKKKNGEQQRQLTRIQSKLDHLSKLWQVFIRSVRSQCATLKEDCLKQSQDFNQEFAHAQQTLIEKLEAIPEIKTAQDPAQEQEIESLKVQMQTLRDQSQFDADALKDSQSKAFNLETRISDLQDQLKQLEQDKAVQSQSHDDLLDQLKQQKYISENLKLQNEEQEVKHSQSILDAEKTLFESKESFSELQIKHDQLTETLTVSLTKDLRKQFEDEKQALLESNSSMTQEVTQESKNQIDVLEQKVEELEDQKAALETNHEFIVQALEREKAALTQSAATTGVDLMQVGQNELMHKIEELNQERDELAKREEQMAIEHGQNLDAFTSKLNNMKIQNQKLKAEVQKLSIDLEQMKIRLNKSEKRATQAEQKNKNQKVNEKKQNLPKKESQSKSDDEISQDSYNSDESIENRVQSKNQGLKKPIAPKITQQPHQRQVNQIQQHTNINTTKQNQMPQTQLHSSQETKPKEQIVEKQIEEKKEKTPKTQDPIKKEKRKNKQEVEKEKTEAAEPSNRLYGLITNFLGLLTKKKKQAFMGKSAENMYFDKDKNRWIVIGDEDESDDEPVAPPPKAKVTQKPVVTDPKTQEQGLNALTQPQALGAFGRGRGRGRGRGGPSFAAPPGLATTSDTPQFQRPLSPESKTLGETRASQSTDQKDLQVIDTTGPEMVVNEDTDIQGLIDQSYDAGKEKMRQHLQKRIKYLKNNLTAVREQLEQERNQTNSEVENLEHFCRELKQEGENMTVEVSNLRHLLSQKMDFEAISQHQQSNRVEDLCLQNEQVVQLRQEAISLKCQLIKAESTIAIQAQSLQSEQDRSRDISDVASARLQEQNNTLLLKNETLEWEKSILQAKRVFAEMQVPNLQDQLSESKQVIQELERQYRPNIQELDELRDAVSNIQSERNQLREQKDKLIAERERLNVQLVEKTHENDIKLRQINAERFKQEKDARKIMHEKNQNWSKRYVELQNKNQQECSGLRSQIQKLTESLDQVQLSRQKEQNIYEKQVKDQLSALQGVNSQQEEDMKNQEAMQQKLNEHIIYLQNEVRKRDDMLDDQENSDSDFDLDCSQSEVNSMSSPAHSKKDKACSEEDVDEFGQSGSLMREKLSSTAKQRTNMTKLLGKQLADTRENLRLQIENNLRIKKNLEIEEAKSLKLVEGLQDIRALFDQQDNEKDDSSQQSSPIAENLVSDVIEIFFSSQRATNAQIMDLEHKLQMDKLGEEDVEALRFDLDIASQENTMLQKRIKLLNEEKDKVEKQIINAQQIEEIELKCKDLEQKLSQQQELNEQEVQNTAKIFEEQLQLVKNNLAEQKLEHDKRVEDLNANHEQICSNLEAELKSITDLNDNLQSQMKSQLETNNKEQTEKNRQITDLYGQIQQHAEQREKQEQTVIELQNKIQRKKELLEAKLKEKQQDEDSLKELVSFSENQNAELLSKMQTILHDKQKQKAKCKDLKSKLIDAEQQAEKTKKLLEAQVAQQQQRENQASLESLAVELQTEKQQTIALKNELNNLAQNLHILMMENGQLSDENQKLKESLESKSQEPNKNENQESLKSQLEQSKVQREQLQLELSEKVNELQEVQSILSEKEATCTELWNSLKETQNQLSEPHGDDNKQDQIDELISQKAALENKLAQQMLDFEQTENQYQTEAIEMASKFKEKQVVLKDKLSRFKEELMALKAENEKLAKDNDKNDLMDQIQRLTNQVQSQTQQAEQNTQLDQEQIEKQRNVLEAEFKAMLQKTNLYQPSWSEKPPEFSEMVKRCYEALTSHAEDKKAMLQLVEGKEEAVRQREKFSFELEKVNAQRDLLQNKIDRTETGKLDAQITQMTEERNEMKAQFMGQLTAFSDEISELKTRLQKHEPIETLQDSTVSTIKKEQSEGSEYEYESEEETTQEKPSGISGMLASFFLTDSELTK